MPSACSAADRVVLRLSPTTFILKALARAAVALPMSLQEQHKQKQHVMLMLMGRVASNTMLASFILYIDARA